MMNAMKEAELLERAVVALERIAAAMEAVTGRSVEGEAYVKVFSGERKKD